MAKKNKNNYDILTIIAIILFIIALITLITTIVKVNSKEKVTGYASGYVNLTVQSSLEINLSISNISFGPGTINSGQENATVRTAQIASAVERGNWSTSARGILMENVGTINVSINILSANNASELFGLVGQEQYQLNLSNKEAGACQTCAGCEATETWIDANETNVAWCDPLGWADGMDETYIDVLLTIPYNTTNMSTSIADTLTITASAAS